MAVRSPQMIEGTEPFGGTSEGRLRPIMLRPLAPQTAGASESARKATQRFDLADTT